jgi:O-antigen ligase
MIYLISFCAVLYFVIPNYYPEGYRFTLIFQFIIGSIVFFNHVIMELKNRKIVINGKPVYIFFCIYFSIILLSTTSSQDLNDLKWYLNYSFTFLYLFSISLLTLFKSSKRIENFLLFLFWITFSTGPIVGFIQFINRKLIFAAPYFDPYRLVTLNQYDPNYAMLALLITINLNFYLLKKSAKLFQTIIYMITFIFSSVSVILTFSRSGLIVYLLMVFIVFFIYGYHRQVRYIYTALCVLLLTFLLLLTSGFLNFVLADNRLNNLGNLESRTLQWKYSFLLIKDKWLLGLGKTQYINELGVLSGHYMSTHNLFLQVLIQRGVLGIIFLLAFLIYIYVNLITCKRFFRINYFQQLEYICNFAIVGVSIYLVMVMTLSDSIGYYLWFYFSITISLISIKRRSHIELYGENSNEHK